MNPPLFCCGWAWLGWWGCTWLCGSVDDGLQTKGYKGVIRVVGMARLVGCTWLCGSVDDDLQTKVIRGSWGQ